MTSAIGSGLARIYMITVGTLKVFRLTNNVWATNDRLYSLPPLTRHRKGNENPVELAGVELARE